MPDTLSITIPDVIPLYPLRDMVAFPHMIFTLFLKNEEFQVFDEAVNQNNMLAVVKLKDEPSQIGRASCRERV